MTTYCRKLTQALHFLGVGMNGIIEQAFVKQVSFSTSEPSQSEHMNKNTILCVCFINLKSMWFVHWKTQLTFPSLIYMSTAISC